MNRIFAIVFVVASVIGGFQAQAALTSNGTSLNGAAAPFILLSVELPVR